jgi:transposase
LVEAIDYNLLYRWFVGLTIDDKVWDHSTFSANRERLFNEDLARVFFERVKLSAQ